MISVKLQAFKKRFCNFSKSQGNDRKIPLSPLFQREKHIRYPICLYAAPVCAVDAAGRSRQDLLRSYTNLFQLIWKSQDFWIIIGH